MVEEIQEDPKRDSLIDALIEELHEFVKNIVEAGRDTNILSLYGEDRIRVYKGCLKDRLREILDHEADKAKQ